MRTTQLSVVLFVLLAGNVIGQDLEADIEKARVGGKYHHLLRIVRIEDDVKDFGRFNDWGHWEGRAYKGHQGLPAGYWVYVHPHWFLWAEKVEGKWSAMQATGAPNTDFRRPERWETAWMPGRGDALRSGRARLEVDFARPVEALAIVLFMYDADALAGVETPDAEGWNYPVLRGARRADRVVTSGLAVFAIRPRRPVARLALSLDIGKNDDRTAVDAVGLLDRKGSIHWAVRAKAQVNPQPSKPEVVRPGKAKVKPSGDSARAVDLALDWLARYQTPEEGYWDADAFFENQPESPADGLGYPLYDPGVTGLALLAYLGAGHTHHSGKYQKTISDAIKYLKRIQDPEGCFGTQTGHFMYSHAIATLALCEAYGMTSSPLIRRSAERGIAFLLKAQNPDPGGSGKLAWRYTIQPGDNDTSVTTWAVMALKSAKSAGLHVDVQEALEGARRWIDRMTDPRTGRVGYIQKGVSPVRSPGREEKWPRSRSEAITSAGILCRIFMGEDPATSDPIQAGARLLLDRLPVWDVKRGSVDPYYWYYGTLAMFQVGGDAWKKWHAALTRAILDSQRTEGPHRGSWDAAGPWGPDGGRVYTTAVLAMCLEVCSRYAKVFGR
jgi:hypothetical protein